jgi:hypothetical protein
MVGGAGIAATSPLGRPSAIQSRSTSICAGVSRGSSFHPWRGAQSGPSSASQGGINPVSTASSSSGAIASATS